MTTSEVTKPLYCVEKDEHGDECLFLTAIVRDGVVDLDWDRPEDIEGTASSRAEQWAKEIGADNRTPGEPPSIPQGQSFHLLRLYRQGYVSVSGSVCNPEDECHVKLVEDAVLALYDSVFPDVARYYQHFVDNNVMLCELLTKTGDVGNVRFIEDEYDVRFDARLESEPLTNLLAAYKEELLKDGDVDVKVGWYVNDKCYVVSMPMPYERYRWGRAVSEVARQVSADAILLLADQFECDEKSNHTGTELLSVQHINPDGSCSYEEVAPYTRKKHLQGEKDIITFLSGGRPEGGEQYLIPAWARTASTNVPTYKKDNGNV